MTFVSQTTESKINRTAVAALSLLISLSMAPAVMAQDAGVSGGFAQGGSLGADQDSLLPPEVVPLDPSAQAARPASPVQRASTPQTTGGSVPGLVENNNPAANMQSAQDFRKAAFNSLYNQGQLPQQQAPQQPLTQWRAGLQLNQDPTQVGQNPGQNPGQGPGQYPITAPGMTPMANNAPAAQSQTLTGGTKYQQKSQNIRRAGLSNGLSAVSAFATGALLGGFFIRQNNPLMQAGVWGLTSTGYGTRNGIRF